jgi:hypothetical protein
MMYMGGKYYVPSSNCSFDMSSERKTKYRYRAPAMLLFYVLETRTLKKLQNNFEHVLPRKMS